MAEPYIIRISSQKGGVGKTTIATNLGVTLSMAGYKVLIVDMDSANPTIGYHLGMNQANVGYKEVITGKARLEQVIAIHAASGLRVLPGTVGPYSFVPTKKQNEDFLQMLSKTKYDFIILDTAPGYAFEEPYEQYDEALIVATPDMPSCTSAIRLANTYTQQKVKHNLILNRMSNRKYEFNVSEIEDMYNDRLIGVIPEDTIVPESVSAHIPALLVNPNANFSKAMRNTGKRYSSRSQTQADESIGSGKGKGIIGIAIWHLKRVIGI
ncbi:MAG: AAA family ATPase [Candidatus Micrarchaeota archaeon]|nr:AAA family ATPase [Candidatus Micrarchaeota archaeon]